MRRLILFICCICLISGKVVTNSPEATAAKVKTVFLYNFTKYIDWPKAYKSGKFVIGVLGSDPYLVEELNKMAEKKRAGSQEFEIKNVLQPTAKAQFHMLFVSPSIDVPMSEILGTLKGKSTLLITEKPGMAKKTSAINFVVLNNRQKFELNRKNAEKYNLKVSSSLASLAILVD